MQQIVDASIKNNRKIVFNGRSMENISKVAIELGYLHIPDSEILIIDDLTNSGETIEKLTQHLIKHGINNQNLFSMALIANVDILSRLHIYPVNLGVTSYFVTSIVPVAVNLSTLS